MYHCPIRFYLAGCRHSTYETVRKLSPLEGFTHDFSESETLEPALAAQADVILAGLSGQDPADLLGRLNAARKEGAQLILLADREQADGLADCLPRDCDLWFTPMPEWELRFRFRNLLRSWRQGRELWQAEQFLETSIGSTPQLIWFKSRDGVYKKVNDAFCRVVGKEKREVEGHAFAHVWDTAENASVRESDQTVLWTGKPGVFQETVQTGEGEMLLTTYVSPLFDLDGSVMGTTGVGVDMTRVQAREQAYRQEIGEKNRTLEMLFATMDCGIMCHTLSGERIISINQAALQLLGYASQEEMERDGYRLVAQSVLDEDKPKLRACITSLKKPGDSAAIEYRVLHKDGKVLNILGNAKLIEENGVLYCQRFLVDITAQKREEEEKWARKDQEIQYQEQIFDIFSAFLSDNIDDVYMMLDGNAGRTEFVSANIERVLGVSRKAVMEDLKNLGLPKYITGQGVDLADLAAMESGESLEPMETERVHKKTQETKWFLESVYCVSVQGEKKIVAYISDRTRERKNQNALSEALETAKVASKAKSTFLSSISHDIRTPMNAIMGLTMLLKQEYGNPTQVLEYAQNISAASQHLLGLINDVLDMNKIESGSAMLNISEFNMAEVVDELNTIIRPQARAKNQTFEIHTSALVSENLLGDRMRINQIMLNILSNAVKYTHDGGRIEMEVSELPQVDPNYSRIRFVVRDNGQGMSESYQKVIFDPFTREQEIIWNQIQGTGLGMAITKNLVDLMGGTIEVSSKLGEGSTFTVELELRVQEQEEDPGFWEQHGILRMLAADDDEDICRDIAKKMAGTGVMLHFATNGKQAVEMISAARRAGDPYDLILLDWRMHGLNGLEVAQSIRKKHAENAPILLFTAYDWGDIREEALAVGIDHFLPKPFFVSSFKDTIQRMNKKKVSLPRANDDGEEGIVAGKQIMVVDDIEVNRIIMTKILTELGAKCEIAVDGQEAVDKFQASQPGEYDMIFMDIQMPRMTGDEAARAIRASSHPAAKEIAIIAVTANAFVGDIRKALDSGMDAHISKPIVLEKLKSTIQDVLDRKKELGL